MRVAIRRIRCKACNASHQEPIAFCADPYVRHTKWAARFVLALRKDMSIKAVAEQTGMHWDAVKNIEKQWLEKKYKKVRLDDEEYLGIDEVYVRLRVHWAYWRKSSPAEVAKPVVESNCVAVMRGGEQQETNRQSAG